MTEPLNIANTNIDGKESFSSWYLKNQRKGRTDYAKYSDNDVLLKFERMSRFFQLCAYQKWLREEHGLHIEIGISGVKTKTGIGWRSFSWQVLDRKTMKEIPKEGYNLVYTTYEKALEKGLQKALSLIKSTNYE